LRDTALGTVSFFEAALNLEIRSADRRGSSGKASLSSGRIEIVSEVAFPHAEMHLRSSTWKVRRYQIETLTTAPLGTPGRTYTLGGKRLTEFSTEHVEEYKRKRSRQASTIAINNELAVLQAIFSFARRLKVPVATFAIEMLPVRGAVV